ncbi:MAG: hypothetical protein AB7O74_15290 [Candidatus Nanopelagicales bacterium]
MTETPPSLILTAERMHGAGQPLSAIVAALQDDGASLGDVVRVAQRLYAVGQWDARVLLAGAGHPIFVEPLTVIVDDDDPFYEQLFGPEPPTK